MTKEQAAWTLEGVTKLVKLLKQRGEKMNSPMLKDLLLLLRHLKKKKTLTHTQAAEILFNDIMKGVKR